MKKSEYASAVYVLPSKVIVGVSAPVTVAKEKGSVLVPTTTAVPPKGYEIGVSETSTLPPGDSVCPFMVKSEDASAVKILPSKVIIGRTPPIMVPKDSGEVLVLTTIAVAPARYEIVVPKIPILPPGVSVYPPKTKSDEASAVKVEPSKLSMPTILTPLRARSSVLLSIKAAFPAAASEICVPDTVMAAPGERVCSPIIYCPSELAEYVEPAKVNA